MKKFLFFVIALVCIGTMSYAQTYREIQPFKPNAEDAAKIKSILAGMNKKAYSIQVNNNSKQVAYGSLGRDRVRSGVPVSSRIGPTAGSWVTEIFIRFITSTKTVDVKALAQLEAIAAKYR